MSDVLTARAQLLIAMLAVGRPLTQAERLDLARALLTTITDPSLAFDLWAVAQEIDETVVRLVRAAFEKEC